MELILECLLYIIPRNNILRVFAILNFQPVNFHTFLIQSKKLSSGCYWWYFPWCQSPISWAACRATVSSREGVYHPLPFEILELLPLRNSSASLSSSQCLFLLIREALPSWGLLPPLPQGEMCGAAEL